MAKVTLKSLDNAKVSVMVQLPIPLKVALDNEADKLDIGPANLMRRILAGHYDMDVEDSRRGRAASGLTDEEKKERQKAKDKQRRELINQLLEQYRKGGEASAIGLLEQMKAQADSDDEEDTEDSDDK